LRDDLVAWRDNGLLSSVNVDTNEDWLRCAGDSRALGGGVGGWLIAVIVSWTDSKERLGVEGGELDVERILV
jgi:hypothetical protein